MNIEIVSRVTLQHVDDDIATLMGACGMDKATWEPGTVSVPIISFIDFSIYLSSSVTQKNIFFVDWSLTCTDSLRDTWCSPCQ